MPNRPQAHLSQEITGVIVSALTRTQQSMTIPFMKRLTYIIAICFLIPACTEGGGSVNADLTKYPKDTDVTASTCSALGRSYDVPPSESATDKCCSGTQPAPYSTRQDASTGYRHFTCVKSDECNKEGSDAEYDDFIRCCTGLVIKDGKCVKESECEFDGEDGVFISAPLAQNECIKFPDCTVSGEIDKFKCEHCCEGSKYTTQNITGTPPERCLAPDENLSAQEKKYWTEPMIVTKLDIMKRKEACSD